MKQTITRRTDYRFRFSAKDIAFEFTDDGKRCDGFFVTEGARIGIKVDELEKFAEEILEVIEAIKLERSRGP